MDTSVVKRGDIYYADLSPVVGSEQGGVRPVLIIQNDTGNKHSPTVIVAAVTSKVGIKAKLPTHFFLEGGKSGLEVSSLVLLEQLRTLDKKRLTDYIGTLSKRQLCGVNHALAVSVGLLEKLPEKMAMCLCATCAANFRGAGGFALRRADPMQEEKDFCTYCGQRRGYDYVIETRNKKS